MTRTMILLTTLGALTLVPPAAAMAQSLGTFRWQLQPYCNIVTVTVTQVGGVYRLEGTDDRCGGGVDLASALGVAFLNPGGSIGIGLSIVTTPAGAPVHVAADIALGTLSGTWRDSAGGVGAFVFSPGAGTGGSPRPQPPPGVPPSLNFVPGGGIVALPDGDGPIPASGAGVRMMWYPGKAAFRAGEVRNDAWDEANVGTSSMAFGRSTRASGDRSTAMGFSTSALGDQSTAMGRDTTASGEMSTAMGFGTIASQLSSTAMGSQTTASGVASTAMGSHSEARGDHSVAMGKDSIAVGASSVAIGQGAIAQQHGSFVFADASSSAQLFALGANEFTVRAAGGVAFFSNPAASIGVRLAPNSAQWTSLSDVNSKHLFRELQGEDILARIARLPVTEWSYKAQDPAVRHIGPTAQDFRAAFGLGEDPLRIGTLDADGVALAGVKALETRTRELRLDNEALRQTLADLYRQMVDERAAVGAELQALRNLLSHHP